MAEQGGDSTTSPRGHEDEALKVALARGMTYGAAGVVVGVSERTVRRRMKEPGFAADVSGMRGEHLGAVTGQLVVAGNEAVEVLIECMGTGPWALRLKAAHLVLTLGAQLRQANELEDRLAALEAAASLTPPTNGSGS